MPTRRTFSWARTLLLLAVAGASFLGGTICSRSIFGRPLPPGRALAQPARRALAADESPTPTPTADVPQTLRIAPEFERQAALLVGCNDVIEYHPRVFTALVAAVRGKMPIIGTTLDENEGKLAARILVNAGLPADAVHFVPMNTQMAWVRDWGPLFVRRHDGSVVVPAFRSPLKSKWARDRFRGDAIAARRLGEMLALDTMPVPACFVGGNMLFNGEGLCASTTKLLAESRAQGLDKKAAAELLKETLGVTQWVLLPRLEGEVTGHVDMFVTLTAPNVAVVGRMDPADDPVNAGRLDEAAAILARQQTTRGPMQVHRVPMPPPIEDRWRTYTNVVYANGTLLVPTFADADPAREAEALALYRRLLSDWEVVGIRCDGLVHGKGLLHCITRGIPSFVPVDGLLTAARAADD